MKSKIVTINGLKCFQVNDKIIDSLAFKSFRPTSKNVSEFYQAGVRLFHVYCSGLASGLKVPYSLYGETWFGDHKYDFTNLDRQIDFFKTYAPDGYVFINIHLDSRPWWLEQNPNNPNSFTHLSQIACNEKWKKDTADYLKALIKHTEDKYNDFVIGYFLLGGYTTEWFSEFDHEEKTDLKEKKYQEYLNNPNAHIPEKDILERPSKELFLKENIKEVSSYRIFNNNLVADTVLYFVKEAQKEIKHNKVLGLFFGYILELLNQRMFEAGHIEYDKINRYPDIDLLATPSSYQFRSYDDVGAYMLLCDTLEKDHKLCFTSFDHTTYLLPTLADNPKRVCGDKETDVALKLLAQMRSGNPKDLLKTKEETIEVMRREFMLRMTKRLGLWWFDMFEGWFYDDDLMNEVKHQIDISHNVMNVDKSSISEVAVFVSGESLYKVNKCSKLNTEIICNQRGGLSRMGAPFDIYSLNDIDENCKKYKVLIFIGSFLLTEEQREMINKLKGDGRTLLFICPPDYSSCGLKGTIKMLEMNIRPLTNLESTIMCDKQEYGYSEEKEDSFYIDDSNVQCLGTYKNSKKTGLGILKKNNYQIVYSGIGNLDATTLRKILVLSGVHIYTETNEGLFVCNNFIGVYSPNHDVTMINLLKSGTYKELYSGMIIESKNKQIVLDTSKNAAKLLMRIK